MAKNKTDLSAIAKLVDAKNFIAAFEALCAIKLQADPAARAIAANLLQAAYWTEHSLGALSASQQTRFFAMGRFTAPEAPATQISRALVLQALWNSQDPADWQTLLKLIQSGTEQTNNKQFLNVARVRSRLHLKQPSQDLAAIIPILGSAMATFLALQKTTTFSEQFEQLFFEIIEPCINAAINDRRIDSWKELVRIEIPQVARVYEHIVQHTPAILTRPDFVLLTPSCFVDKASWYYNSFLQVLRELPTELQEPYTPQGQEHNTSNASLAILGLKYDDEVRAGTKYKNGIFCFPEESVRKLIARSSDEVTARLWETKLEDALCLREFSELIYKQDDFWKRYQPHLTAKAPIKYKSRFLKMLLNLSKVCAETNDMRALQPIYEVFDKITNCKTTRKPLLPYLPHGREMKRYLKCKCCGCIRELSNITAVKLKNELQESLDEIIFAWPKKENLIERIQAKILDVPTGPLNAFFRLGLPLTATKKDILACVMTRMRQNPQEMPQLREAQNQLFNPNTHVIHQFFGALDC